jgi:hypothetical protein
MIAQVIGAVVAAFILYIIASGKDGFSLAGGFAANGYGEHSPGGYTLLAALVAEVVLTFMFLMIILGATDSRAPAGFAPIAIGLGLTLIHLIGIPVTNLSVNPARSTGPALFVGGWAIGQLWLFWFAPLVGAFLAGLAYPAVVGEKAAMPRLKATPAVSSAIGRARSSSRSPLSPPTGQHEGLPARLVGRGDARKTDSGNSTKQQPIRSNIGRTRMALSADAVRGAQPSRNARDWQAGFGFPKEKLLEASGRGAIVATAGGSPSRAFSTWLLRTTGNRQIPKWNLKLTSL